MHEHQTSRRTYEDALQRAFQKSFESLERVESDRKAAPDQIAELLALSRPERKKALGSKSRFHNYSLAAHALARSEQELCRDPALAWEIACLARSVVEKIDPQTCGGADALRDLSAYAVAVQGNTLRVRGDFRSAFRAYRNARILQRMGGIDLDLTANIDLLESSLRRDLWQFDSALALLNRATEIFVSLGEQERVARTVIGRANVYNVKGDWAQASTIPSGPPQSCGCSGEGRARTRGRSGVLRDSRPLRSLHGSLDDQPPAVARRAHHP
jgi:tetratricopeptide (TPR) repeat protein